MDTTKPSYLELQRHSPYRSPAWRWERAQHLVEQGCTLSPRLDDALTCQAVCYLRACKRSRGDSQRARPPRAYPDVHAARLLHETTSSTALEVQARLLARQTVEDIARRTAVPARVVRTYERFFFNVLDRLGATDWVVCQAIRRGDARRDLPSVAAMLLRGFAFFGGPALLDALLPFLRGDLSWMARPPDLSTPEGRLAHSLRLVIEIERLGADVPLRHLADLHAQVRRIRSRPPVRTVPKLPATAAAGLLAEAVAAPSLPAEKQPAGSAASQCLIA